MMQAQFSIPLLNWFDCHGRKDLPWQHPRTAYRVWLSEIMLQQTQVKTVIPYFNRFIAHFPDIWQLAQASDEQVLALWSGLGYYSRARNLHKTAQIICEQYQGEFPADLTKLQLLPGIGPSTAAAIASQAFNQPTPILDGNVKRVLCRYFLIDGWPEQSAIKQKLWQLASQCMPTERCADYTQAIMDLGATCCTIRKPNCTACPLQQTCLAKRHEQALFYPHKRSKKPLPVRQQQFLLLYDETHRIYLERRPPTGIWGGLWCMPCIDMATSPKAHIEKTYALTSLNMDELLELKHSFSHFHLEIKALTLQVCPAINKIAECSGTWFRADELASLGLATPVSNILHYFFQTVGVTV